MERRSGLIDRMLGCPMVMAQARMSERVNEGARKVCRDFDEWLKAYFEDGEVAEEKIVETP